jgi:acyl-CoA thioesterase
MMSDDEIKAFLNNDMFAVNCGIEIKEVRAGYARCSLPVKPVHLNGIGTLMGGAVFTLADFTFSVAANSYGTIAVTLNAFVSFMRPCSSGIVTAEAVEISRSGKTGVYQVSVKDESGKIISEVTGTCYFKEKPEVK